MAPLWTKDDLKDYKVELEYHHSLASIFEKSANSLFNSKLLSDSLKLPHHVSASIIPTVQITSKPLYNAYTTILENWLSRNGNKATFGVLFEALGSTEVSWLDPIDKILECKWKGIKKTKVTDSQVVFGPTVTREDETDDLHSPTTTIKRKNFKSFGIEKPVENFCGRSDEIEKLRKVIKEKKDSYIVLSGSGGVGKTELSRKLADTFKNDETILCTWVTGETEQDMEISLQQLATHIGVPSGGNASELISRLGAFITKHRFWLLFLDNVDEMTPKVKSVLIAISQKFEGKTTALVTSRNVGILCPAPHKAVNLAELKANDSKELLMKSLKIKEEDSSINQLCKTLQNYPLALQQAIAYIRERKVKSIKDKSYGLADYLKEYEREKKKLLDHPVCPFTNKYDLTVYTTWNVTINKLNEINSAAANLLNVIAFLKPDRIIVEDLQLICKKQTTFQNNAIDKGLELLKIYSLVRIKNNVITVHRLVQEVVKLYRKEDQLEFTILEDIIHAITNIALELPYKNRKQKREIHKHIREVLSIWKYATKTYRKEAYLKMKFIPNHIAKKMKKIGYTQQLDFYTTCFVNMEKIFGPSDKEVQHMKKYNDYAQKVQKNVSFFKKRNAIKRNKSKSNVKNMTKLSK